jgi:hypothetical protein
MLYFSALKAHWSFAIEDAALSFDVIDGAALVHGGTHIVQRIHNTLESFSAENCGIFTFLAIFTRQQEMLYLQMIWPKDQCSISSAAPET